MWWLFIILLIVLIIPTGFKTTQIGGEACSCNPSGEDKKRCPPVKCKTQGLVLQYFDTNRYGATLRHFRTEAHNHEINYDWKGGNVLNSNRKDNVKLKFTGLIRAPTTGPVEFRSRSDDGVRVFIDGQPVIEQWRLQGPTYQASPPVQMVEGEYYPFKLEWYEHGGGATLSLEWRYNDGDWTIIPSNRYFYNDGDYQRAPKPKPYGIKNAQTPPNHWGNGNAIYLDRHSVDCGMNGINQFHLRRPRGNQINYKYKCLTGINAVANIHRNTGTNDWGGGNTIFLDRHDVQCNKHPIARFRLVRPKGNKLRYNYTCNSKKSTGPCRKLDTGWNQESKHNIYLDRHNVKCNKDEVLTRFKLRRNGRGKFRYDYTCCRM